MKFAKITSKPSIPETLRSIKPGESCTYRCSQLGLYSSVGVAVCRLNKAAGYVQYELETADCGATYTVTRNRRPI